MREVFGGAITLDPCTQPSNPTRATITACLERGENGLHEWPLDLALAHGLRPNSFVNPPYGRALGPWIRHCAAQAALGWEVITLTPGRPDTAWYDELVHACALHACIRGRLIFELDGRPVLDKHGKPSPCQFPCVLGYMGLNEELFADVMSRDGFARIERGCEMSDKKTVTADEPIAQRNADLRGRVPVKRKPRAKAPSEATEARKFVAWLELNGYEGRFTHIPSGVSLQGPNKFATIAKLKSEGWRPGWPDYVIALKPQFRMQAVPAALGGGVLGGDVKRVCFVELKKRGGKADADQVRVIEMLPNAKVCVTADEAIAWVLECEAR